MKRPIKRIFLACSGPLLWKPQITRMQTFTRYAWLWFGIYFLYVPEREFAVLLEVASRWTRGACYHCQHNSQHHMVGRTVWGDGKERKQCFHCFECFPASDGMAMLVENNARLTAVLSAIRELHQPVARTACKPQCPLCSVLDCPFGEALHYQEGGCPRCLKMA